MSRTAHRLAWFSPMPPSRSGIAAYSAEVLPLLRRGYDIDVFVGPASPDLAASFAAHDAAARQPGTLSAHDFVWKHRRNPYDLTVFQLGNAAYHGYMWAYLFRYPGLVVLHDAQLHQARALWLLTERVVPRRDDYRAEFRGNHPDASPEVAELIVAGLGQPSLYQRWPFLRLVLEQARLTLVHNRRLCSALAEEYAHVSLDTIEMGVEEPRPTVDRATIRARHGIPRDALVVAALGGVTPEKRLAPLMRAMQVVAFSIPKLHLMIVGEPVSHFDAGAEARACGIPDRVHVTGYVPDSEVASYIAAADICSCLRWPSNRETSASWLRCLAARKPTLITALSQLSDLPDVSIAIDVLNEETELPRGLHRLAKDASERTRLGDAARVWWETHHQLENMARGYERAIEKALTLATRAAALPDHLRLRGDQVLSELAAAMHVTPEVSDLLG